MVMIYKGNQKNSRSPSSSRPISLANSIYKVYACAPTTPCHSIGQFLHPNQYGFRSGRSISTPLFLLRRLTEMFERHPTSLDILFLDWSQAFDSSGHPHVAAALRRYGVPPLYTCKCHDAPLPKLSVLCDRSCWRFPILSIGTWHSHSFFREIFAYTPWTRSSSHPLADVECR